MDGSGRPQHEAHHDDVGGFRMISKPLAAEAIHPAGWRKKVVFGDGGTGRVRRTSLCSDSVFMKAEKGIELSQPRDGQRYMSPVTTAIIGVKRKAMAKKAKKARGKRKSWSKEDVKLLKQHSRARTPVAVLAKTFKRTPGALRQKAQSLGIGLGHQR